MIEQWADVEDLPKIERNFYDIILLDVQAVGKQLSSKQGLGVLEHIRKTAPAQIVIAFSNADYSLKYQEFFKMADRVLSKGADYVDFKRQVDELLRSRFSLGFYIEKVLSVVGSNVDDEGRLERETRKAILRNNPQKLRKYLIEKISDEGTLQAVLSVVNLAIEVAKIWNS